MEASGSRFGIIAQLEHFQQIRAEQIAALLQLGRVPLGTIAIERCFHFIMFALRPYFSISLRML
jgi:hypothetical protein